MSSQGTFSNTTGEEFDASIAFEIDGTGVPSYTEIFENGEQVSETFEETDNSFVDVTLTIEFSAELNGISDAVDIEVEISRSGVDDFAAEATLQYPGRTISIDAEINDLDGDGETNGSLTLTNNDGVAINITGDEATENEDGDIMGTITLDNVEYAELDTVDGAEIIRYSDGTFESAF